MKSYVSLAVLLCLSGSGCREVYKVDIDSKPTGATVYVDGERRGVTRTTVTFDFGGDPTRRVLIQIVKPRYKPSFQYWTREEIPEDRKKVFQLEVD